MRCYRVFFGIFILAGNACSAMIGDPQEITPDAQGSDGPDAAIPDLPDAALPDSRWPTTAGYCQAPVTSVGTFAVESNYLPQVVACENGNASYDALKAQAVSARTYLYYKLNEVGSITDGQGDQVYTCANLPGPDHIRAVEDTSGQVLFYGGSAIAAFYVAGALQEGPTCRGGQNDPTSTEHFVTYNKGRSAANIEQTGLGWVDPSNLTNRGCMSQNGSDCLSNIRRNYQDILRFYYGADIVFTQALASCIQPVR